MKKIWKILGAVALVAGLVPYKAEENLETGEKTFDALLWQVRTCRNSETGKSEVTAVSIIPNRLARYHEEAHLFDDDAREAYERDRTNTARAGADDLNVGDNFDRMEDIARRVPLSRVNRPQWDVEVLTALGLAVETDHRVWERVWSSQEKLNLASTPMFMVCGYKRAGAMDRALLG